VSFQGILGSLVKGPAPRLSKVRLLTCFAAAFFGGALVTFGGTSIAVAMLGVDSLPASARVGVAGAVLIVLAALDLAASRAGSYCPLGWRRQTPQRALHRYGAAGAMLVWGADTGLAITTFRVNAMTWAALALVALGYSSWWSGVGYASAFITSLLLAMRTEVTVDRLTHMLHMKAPAQAASRALLTTAGVSILIYSVWA
jgi:hypothetical protein